MTRPLVAPDAPPQRPPPPPPIRHTQRTERDFVVQLTGGEDTVTVANALERDGSDFANVKLRNLDSPAVDDLINLTHLHEPAILEALSVRFARDVIYTNTGTIVLAVNPFQRLPALYSKQVRAGVGKGGGGGGGGSAILSPATCAVHHHASSGLLLLPRSTHLLRFPLCPPHPMRCAALRFAHTPQPGIA
jgi:hypothetical protein